jgi:signal transduction histidine kinase
VQCLELIAGESRRCGEIDQESAHLLSLRPDECPNHDLNAMIDRCLLLGEASTGNGRHSVATRSLRTICPSCQCDPNHIEQVLLALIMNAIDAMPRMRQPLAANPAEELRSGGIEIEVRDDGAGISPEILPGNLSNLFLRPKKPAAASALGWPSAAASLSGITDSIQVESEFGKGHSLSPWPCRF